MADQPPVQPQQVDVLQVIEELAAAQPEANMNPIDNNPQPVAEQPAALAVLPPAGPQPRVGFLLSSL
jgi:hypothetical protein